MIEGALRRIDPDQSSGFSFIEFVGTLEISNADVLLLLHRNRDVCVPGDVTLVANANLNLIEHSRIDNTSVVFPSIRTSESDRLCALVESTDRRSHRSLHGCGTPRSLSLPRVGGRSRRID